MHNELCVRCGDRPRVYAVIGDDRLCHGLGYPTCYEAASAAVTDNNWALLKESWSRLRTDTLIGIEQLRRWHPDITTVGPLTPHFLTSIGAPEVG